MSDTQEFEKHDDSEENRSQKRLPQKLRMRFRSRSERSVKADPDDPFGEAPRDLARETLVAALVVIGCTFIIAFALHC